MVQSDITRMTSLDIRKSLGNSLINQVWSCYDRYNTKYNKGAPQDITEISVDAQHGIIKVQFKESNITFGASGASSAYEDVAIVHYENNSEVMITQKELLNLA